MNEIETLLCKIYGCDRSSLYLDVARAPLSPPEASRLERLLRRRISGAPLQYLTEDAVFMDLRLSVRPGVLIPRPETEILVGEAIREIAAAGKKRVRILDIGTGSGNIAIALAAHRFSKALKVFAVDISDACLDTARRNARKCGVEEKIIFLKSDLFGCFGKRGVRFDLIVANPPYIPIARYDFLPEDVRREPALALLGGEDGLDFYRRIEDEAKGYLCPGGSLVLEIGDDQREGIEDIFADSTAWASLRFVKDWNGRDRVVVIQRVR